MRPCGSSPRGRGKRKGRRHSGPPGRLIPAWAGKTDTCPYPVIRTTAHPRVGGENHASGGGDSGAEGSSPRGRGKQSVEREYVETYRLIPAWAGKTPSWRRSIAASPAHPRVGGENGAAGVPVAWVSGSSPRGRGKPKAKLVHCYVTGLIPAWAGKTRSSNRPRLRGWAHPRVGGENRTAPRAMRLHSGSSPRGRGKRRQALAYRPSCGLIPAWAGKTAQSPEPGSRRAAHPRVGGENRVRETRFDLDTGSSPRGRGKPSSLRSTRTTRRLIPAWAGKTRRQRSRSHRVRAHPRVGGENRTIDAARKTRRGSSPRGRGKPHGPPRCLPSRPAHPRVGGENAKASRILGSLDGSSPRGRGKRSGSLMTVHMTGLIPAWAGKTALSAHSRMSRPAHPRVGGENAIITDPPYGIAGSSPRGRGKLSRDFDPGVTRVAHPRVGGENGS